MPRVEQYEALVKVTVELRAEGRSVGSYSVTRAAIGSSINAGGTGAIETIEAALVDAVAAHRALAAGVQNAERRRLK